ncbi:hypothetical protein GMST_16260 [Geomonas silvestris]|uniref:Uncharacterized protein n=1 Tax=Geomonas silvestris TaxID=2740184 RepID=A0A6V8MH34_9BACT|nr:hypothetical protein [Geomonas silvestris]GFO59301.1 hypothetical protein GMST_16260 [Geomonas silvestris]
MFSLMLDYDEESPVSICGFAKLWTWSEGRVTRFFKEAGVSIEYPKNKANYRNQRGVIVMVKAEEAQRSRGGIKAIDSRWLRSLTEESHRNNGGKAEKSCRPTKEPKPKPKPNKNPKPEKPVSGLSAFAQFWEAYPTKKAKAAAEESWAKINPDVDLLTVILKALDQQKGGESWQKDNGRFIPHAATWLNGRRWEDEAATNTPTHLPITADESEKIQRIWEIYDN